MTIDPKVFKRAMRKVAQGFTCCPCIDWGYDDDQPTREMVFFRELFGMQDADIYEAWWPRDDLGVRIIALQLAACVAADGAL